MNDLVDLSKLDQNKSSDQSEKTSEIPQNIDAEQALLGALLINNEIFDKINHILKPQHFFDPVHQRIYEICAEKISRNSLASPVTGSVAPIHHTPWETAMDDSMKTFLNK